MLRAMLRRLRRERLFGMLDDAIELLSPAKLAAFDGLLAQIEHAGSSESAILFFADEGGISCFGIDRERVLPAWYACFAEVTAKDGTFERRVAEIVARGGPSSCSSAALSPEPRHRAGSSRSARRPS